ncbi:MAG: transcription antitermination factor NusB [Thermodesulfovibrionales bacterium]|nr:transcription antitermination factor NusB [Thermodesulfovibrionales bacterium]
MKRRASREYAVQFLYGIDFFPHIPPDIIERFDAFLKEQGEQRKDVIEFSKELVRGCIETLDEIDNLIQTHAINWSFDRIANIDRAILRVAIYELLTHKEISSAIVIDEALEIAKKFSTKEAPPFINGLLDKISKIVR